MNIARNPGSNVAAIFALVTGQPVFEPTLSAVPSDWTIAINYTGGGLNAPKGTAFDASGNIWVANSGTGANSLSEFNNAGTAISNSAGFTGGGLNLPTALAVDLTGNVWVANAGSGTSVLSKFTSAGTPVSSTGYTGGGLNAPKSISVDGNGNVWLANFGANTVSEFSNNGTALSGTGGYSGGGVTAPVGIAINPN
jgi:streptogramin lyase